MITREMIAESDEDMLFADGLDAALIGVCYRHGQPPIACYDYEKAITLIRSWGMSHDDATEYFEFNTVGAWVGDYTPCYVEMLAPEEDE